MNPSADAIPQKIPPRNLYFWPDNPRYAPLSQQNELMDANKITDSKIQRAYVRRVKASKDHTAPALKRSIELYGLLGNPIVPIAVCSLPAGGYVVVDGNARVMGVKDLLADEAWCAGHREYAESLKAGIMVMDFGAFADPEVQTAVLVHTSRIHMGAEEAA